MSIGPKPGQPGQPEHPVHPANARRGQGITADGEFFMPTRVFFGRGLAAQAGVQAAGLGAHKVMLVTDPGVQAAGLADPVRDDLAGTGLDVLAFQQVEPNPRDVDCLAGTDLAVDGLGRLRRAAPRPAARRGHPDHRGHRQRGQPFGSCYRHRAQEEDEPL